MLKKIVHRVLHKRHFWRDVGFDELSELYVGTMMRSLAMGVSGVFIPIYLYKLDYSIAAVMWYAAGVFFFRCATDIIAAYYIARKGPKHCIMLSYVLLIAMSLLFALQPQLHVPLWTLAFLNALASSFFFIAYHVDFSKIKHIGHSGKELGYMNIMDQIGRTFGPLIGGVVATIFGSPYLFLVAIVVLCIGAWSLQKTGEPVRTRQKLDFKSLDVRPLIRDSISYSAFNIENSICVLVWPFFIGVFVLVDQIYLRIGILSSMAVIISVLSSLVIGKLVDASNGRMVLRVSAILNAFIHVTRPFTGTFFQAAVVNAANETVTSGYRLPYIKGFYDRADSLEGHRIVYISSIESISQITRGTFFAILAVIAGAGMSREMFTVAFILGAACSLLIMTENFPALNRVKKYH